MYQLTVSSGPDAGRSLSLQPGRAYVIGRDQGLDLTCPDASMSRQHAEVSQRAGAWVLVNRSQHGVLVGGQVVQGEVTLQPGLAVTLGGTTLLFEEGAGAPVGGPVSAAAGKAKSAAAGPRSCPSCAEPVPPGAEHCPSCGEVLATPPPPPAPQPSWVLPCGCGCASYLGCAVLTWVLVMAALAAMWEMRIQRELRAEESAVVASIAAPILGLLFGVAVLVVMRMRENKKAR